MPPSQILCGQERQPGQPVPLASRKETVLHLGVRKLACAFDAGACSRACCGRRNCAAHGGASSAGQGGSKLPHSMAEDTCTVQSADLLPHAKIEIGTRFSKHWKRRGWFFPRLGKSQCPGFQGLENAGGRRSVFIFGRMLAEPSAELLRGPGVVRHDGFQPQLLGTCFQRVSEEMIHS